ncbi:putative ribonuclease H-like domain-containing protein [Tanacetum coccineum]
MIRRYYRRNRRTDKAKILRKQLKPGKLDTGTEEHARSREEAIKQQTSYSSSHWLKPKKECHIGLKEAQRKWQFTLVTLSKEAQDVSITDCQAGNPWRISKIEEEVYVCQPPGFEDPDFPDRVYEVEKALYGLHQAPRAWYETLSTYLLDNGFQRGKIDKTLFIRRVKASTPMETHKPLLKDADGEDVDEHLYRSMIGSLMYLTSSRPDIMFAVCQPKLGLWYPKDSPFDLVAYTDTDYAGASLDRKSTTGGCQFLGFRLISWQRKKQTVVANSTTKAEYIAASNCYGQVLWIQNQLLDYGYNFMQTKIHIDNESTICIVKNPVFHSKTKHIEIM